MIIRALKAASRHWNLPATVFVVVNLLALAGTGLMAQPPDGPAQPEPVADAPVSIERIAAPEDAPNEGQRQELERRIAVTSFRLRTNEADVQAAEARIASLKKSLEQLPTTIVTQKVPVANAALESMRHELVQAEARERELAEQLQDNHPRLLAARQVVRDLRLALAEQPNEGLQTTEAANPARQARLQELTAEQAAADALRNSGRELAALRERLESELQVLHSPTEPPQQVQPERVQIKTPPSETTVSNIAPPPAAPAQATLLPRTSLLGLVLLAAVLSCMGLARIAARFKPAPSPLAKLMQLLDLPLVGRLPREVFHPPART